MSHQRRHIRIKDLLLTNIRAYHVAYPAVLTAMSKTPKTKTWKQPIPLSSCVQAVLWLSLISHRACAWCACCYSSSGNRCSCILNKWRTWYTRTAPRKVAIIAMFAPTSGILLPPPSWLPPLLPPSVKHTTPNNMNLIKQCTCGVICCVQRCGPGCTVVAVLVSAQPAPPPCCI